MTSRLAISILTIILALLPLTQRAAAEPATVAVGDRAVSGTTIGPYRATWTQKVKQEGAWVDGGTISEEAQVTTHEGKEALRHVQTVKNPSGQGAESTMIFERASLAPRFLRQQILNPPPGAPSEQTFTFQGPRIERRVTLGSGEIKSSAEELPMPMFYGMTFGLVIATLPLEEGYEARLPVAIPQQGYKSWVVVRVVGRERYTAKGGKPVQAWLVETDWVDLDSGEITSKGGADEQGGVYAVVPHPPAGFPYVPKYANANVLIEVM